MLHSLAGGGRRRIGLLAVIAVAAVIGPAGAAPAAPARPASVTGPAAPARLAATNGTTSISLTWVQPAAGTRPVSFRVYEGDTVVARNTTTRVTVVNLPFGSVHTYRVTAVDAAGRESAPSEPVTRSVFVGGAFPCGGTPPGDLVATRVTATAVSLSWSNEVPSFDRPGPVTVLRDSVPVRETGLDSARIGGLAPATTYTFQAARRDCNGLLHPSAPVTVTTARGARARGAAPAGLTVGARTATSIALSWAASGGTPVARYAVYEGATRVAGTAATATVLGGLWRDTPHEYTVAALDATGAESAHSAPVYTSTQPCPDPRAGPLSPVNAPTAVTATAVSSSTVSLAWVQEFDAGSFTVRRSTSPGLPPEAVVTTRVPSAVVTGLPPGDSSTYTVVAHTGCGDSSPSAGVTVATPAGPAARPEAPVEPRVTATVPHPDSTGTVSLAWTQPAGPDPAVGFRLYEGGTLLATSATREVTLRLPGGPTHTVTVVAVDAAGSESAQSPPVVFTVPFLPPP
jgi:fibronectin type 3 domain-containing protein